MEKEMKSLKQLKGENPFTMPEGYLEGFTQQLMEKLPERTFEAPRKVSLLERVLPLIYLAAAIAGLGFFFDVLNGGEKKNEGTAVSSSENFIVQSNISSNSLNSPDLEESADYLEYLETQYANYLLAEEIESLE